MKIFTPEKFEEFLARTDWKREQDQDITDRLTRDEEDYVSDSGELVTREIEFAYGWASMTSTLDGVTITYTEGFNFEAYQAESLTTGTAGLDEVWRVEGVKIIDDDGDERDPLDWLIGSEGFDSIEYDFLDSEFNQTNDIDIDKDTDMDTITIEVDNAPNLRFTGEQVASASSSANNAFSNYSGSTGRWTELTLYKTAGGKFVCEQVGRTQWQGEHDRRSGKVCDDEQAVREFFGHGWLAKELYEEANIEDVQEIE